ncbi:hypothetical protein K438DRAFT_1785147 [Mycena galopus ATCC 62051]|nr:hypothetical protein K438DRAFT_1785147 [Mycena galopus ATCC 62051]
MQLPTANEVRLESQEWMRTDMHNATLRIGREYPRARGLEARGLSQQERGEAKQRGGYWTLTYLTFLDVSLAAPERPKQLKNPAGSYADVSRGPRADHRRLPYRETVPVQGITSLAVDVQADSRSLAHHAAAQDATWCLHRLEHKGERWLSGPGGWGPQRWSLVTQITTVAGWSCVRARCGAVAWLRSLEELSCICECSQRRAAAARNGGTATVHVGAAGRGSGHVHVCAKCRVRNLIRTQRTGRVHVSAPPPAFDACVHCDCERATMRTMYILALCVTQLWPTWGLHRLVACSMGPLQNDPCAPAHPPPHPAVRDDDCAADGRGTDCSVAEVPSLFFELLVLVPGREVRENVMGYVRGLAET